MSDYGIPIAALGYVPFLAALFLTESPLLRIPLVGLAVAMLAIGATLVRMDVLRTRAKIQPWDLSAPSGEMAYLMPLPTPEDYQVDRSLANVTQLSGGSP